MPLFEPNIQTISAGTTWATGPGVSFQNGNGVTFGLNGNTITASVVGGGGAAQPITVFSQWGGFNTNYTASAAQASYQKVSMPMPISASAGIVLLDIAGKSASSGGITISVGAYALSGGTAATLSTASAAFSWTSGSATTAASIYGGISGTRYRSFPWVFSMTPGDYLFAVAFSSTNDATVRVFGRQGVNLVGIFAGVETAYFVDGISISTTGAFPTSIAATDTNYVRTGLQAVQQPGFLLIGTH